MNTLKTDINDVKKIIKKKKENSRKKEKHEKVNTKEQPKRPVKSKPLR